MLKEVRLPRRERVGDSEIIWKGDKVLRSLNLSMTKRVRLATELVKTKVVRNISRPVTKGVGPRGGRLITNRSKSGEFPKADTTLLMKSIISDVTVDKVNQVIDGKIGTPLDYGVILELHMNRSFLVRTIREEQPMIRKILGKPLTSSENR